MKSQLGNKGKSWLRVESAAKFLFTNGPGFNTRRRKARLGSAKNALLVARLSCSVPSHYLWKGEAYKNTPKLTFHLLYSPVTVKQIQSGYTMQLLVLQQVIWKWGSSVLPRDWNLSPHPLGVQCHAHEMLKLHRNKAAASHFHSPYKGSFV